MRRRVPPWWARFSVHPPRPTFSSWCFRPFPPCLAASTSSPLPVCAIRAPSPSCPAPCARPRPRRRPWPSRRAAPGSGGSLARRGGRGGWKLPRPRSEAGGRQPTPRRRPLAACFSSGEGRTGDPFSLPPSPAPTALGPLGLPCHSPNGERAEPEKGADSLPPRATGRRSSAGLGPVVVGRGPGECSGSVVGVCGVGASAKQWRRADDRVAPVARTRQRGQGSLGPGRPIWTLVVQGPACRGGGRREWRRRAEKGGERLRSGAGKFEARGGKSSKLTGRSRSRLTLKLSKQEGWSEGKGSRALLPSKRSYFPRAVLFPERTPKFPTLNLHQLLITCSSPVFVPQALEIGKKSVTTKRKREKSRRHVRAHLSGQGRDQLNTSSFPPTSPRRGPVLSTESPGSQT